MDWNCNDDTLAEMIDTRIRLNWEIEKDEAYWEQRACANWLRSGGKTLHFSIDSLLLEDEKIKIYG